MTAGMKRLGLGIVFVWVLVALGIPASAHITNTKTLFPDIAASPDADDIVALVALGIVPNSGYFHPDESLTRTDLAAWAALAHRVGEGGENPDLQKLAADGKSFVGSTSGNATAADISKAIFDGTLTLTNPNQTFTHEQAAAFIADHLSPQFLSKLGVEPGPTGVITAITSQSYANGHTAYTFTLGDKSYLVYAHCKVVGPTDLSQWNGLEVTRSYVEEINHVPALLFIQSADAS